MNKLLRAYAQYRKKLHKIYPKVEHPDWNVSFEILIPVTHSLWTLCPDVRAGDNFAYVGKHVTCKKCLAELEDE